MKRSKTNKELKYTSTKIKILNHPRALKEYIMGGNNTVISTHISPEGRCNLRCSYCSVEKRNKSERINFGVIQRYIEHLCQRGLKACIITGGGEPTLYPKFNELVTWLHNKKNLKVALITNGTNSDNVKVWDKFTWVRISINNFNNWKDSIYVPRDKMDPKSTLGMSCILTEKNKIALRDLEDIARKNKAEYVRLLPDCTLSKRKLKKEHKEIKKELSKLESDILFHQIKIHKAPKSNICHQAYFRPYLSEEGGGVVYPCDSLVLNNKIGWFSDKYAICKAKDVLKFLDGKITMSFKPKIDCKGCVFTETVDMLNNIKKSKKVPEITNFNTIHKEFI